MSFAYDVCSYLLEFHSVWDKTSVENGFNLDLDSLNVPDTSFESASGLYLNQIPSDRTDAVCVYDTGGYEASRMYGTCKAFENPTAQIRVRNHSMKVADATVYHIYSLLDDVSNVTIDDRKYLQINAVAPPTYIGEDMVTSAGTCYEYSLNLFAKVRCE